MIHAKPKGRQRKLFTSTRTKYEGAPTSCTIRTPDLSGIYDMLLLIIAPPGIRRYEGQPTAVPNKMAEPGKMAPTEYIVCTSSVVATIRTTGIFFHFQTYQERIKYQVPGVLRVPTRTLSTTAVVVLQ